MFGREDEDKMIYHVILQHLHVAVERDYLCSYSVHAADLHKTVRRATESLPCIKLLAGLLHKAQWSKYGERGNAVHGSRRSLYMLDDV